jgi:hypothetical protein
MPAIKNERSDDDMGTFTVPIYALLGSEENPGGHSRRPESFWLNLQLMLHLTLLSVSFTFFILSLRAQVPGPCNPSTTLRESLRFDVKTTS